MYPGWQIAAKFQVPASPTTRILFGYSSVCASYVCVCIDDDRVLRRRRRRRRRRATVVEQRSSEPCHWSGPRVARGRARCPKSTTLPGRGGGGGCGGGCGGSGGGEIIAVFNNIIYVIRDIRRVGEKWVENLSRIQDERHVEFSSKPIRFLMNFFFI